jgi:hypothetical protein
MKSIEGSASARTLLCDVFVNKARVAVIAGHTERLAFIEHPSPGPPAGQRSFLVEVQMIDAA